MRKYINKYIRKKIRKIISERDSHRTHLYEYPKVDILV